MPLVMSFIRLRLQAHWLQQQPLICLVQTQSYFSRPTHGQPLLAQRKLNMWLLAVAVLAVQVVLAAEVVLVDLGLLQACLLLLVLLTRLL
jgi:hypothetical protein